MAFARHSGAFWYGVDTTGSASWCYVPEWGDECMGA
jgi:hypothetical protein